MSQLLYERLGGTEGIIRIASDLVDNHLLNPALAPRFLNADPEKLKRGAASFFISGTGGPNVYEGKDMLSTHKGLNISEHEFIATLDDALKALQKNNIGQREQEEVLFVLYSMKSDIVLV
jgi:hemoglobin